MGDVILGYANYWVSVVLLLSGIYVVMAYRNFVRKLIGMSLMQTAVILFFISIAVKARATVPILEEHATLIVPAHYDNPLPHVLMLTAIVVGVSTLGVSLALVIRIHKDYGTLEEDVLIRRMRELP
ncbi:MAG: cation:proton antiporter subunit C [Vicinamibacteria bacterium]|nr:cation:proton antiporter subunit C [Vicinamibacteria bacterium]